MLDIDCIKDNFANAIISRCSEESCELKLNNLSNYVVLKGEGICTDRRMCDCIIFTEGICIIIGIVELKGKTAHANEIVEKLANASEIALDILENCSENLKYEFYHLVLCKRWRTSEYMVITNRKIRVRGKRYDIIPKSCGVSFSAVIAW